MLFPAICDVIRNLSGIWKMKFPDKLVRYLDVPQNFDRDIGGAFYRRELEELSQELVRHGARELTDEALRDSIRKYNECSRLVRELYTLRQNEPWRVPTSELYAVMRAALNFGGVYAIRASAPRASRSPFSGFLRSRSSTRGGRRPPRSRP